MDREEKNKLAEENIALVYSIVNKRFNYKSITKEDKENYIGEGIVGLVKAINKFDENKGFAFSTFAYKCINGEISMYITKQKCQKRKVDAECKASIDNKVPHCEGLEYSDWLMDMKDDYSSLGEKEHILDMLEKTKIKDIKTIVVKKAEGYKNKEIAKMIGANENTIRKRLDKARDKLFELGITA